MRREIEVEFGCGHREMVSFADMSQLAIEQIIARLHQVRCSACVEAQKN